MMLYQVTVLLCSLATMPDVAECSRTNAIAVRIVPGFAVEEFGDKGAHRCVLMAQRSAMLLVHENMQSWMQAHPNEPSDHYDRSKIATKVLCEPAREWHPPPSPDTPPTLKD